MLHPLAIALLAGLPGAPDTLLQLPAPSGPHAVGVVDVAWVDPTREETATEAPGDRRRGGARIWYPALAASPLPAVAYLPGRAAMIAGLQNGGEGDRRLAALLESQSEVRTHARVDALVDPAGAPHPVVLISAGGNVSHLWHAALAEELASHGYVVASIVHPYSGLEVLPELGLVGSIDWGLDQEDEAAARAADDRMSDVLAADAASVLDRLAEPSGPFPASAIDVERVGIVGHSRGGSTVGRGCATDPRYDACVVLDNIGPDTEAETGLPRPHLALRAGDWPEARVERLRAYLGRNAVEAWDVPIRGAHHFTFADLSLLGFPNPEGSIDPQRGHRVYARIVRAFLDCHVRGEDVSIAAIAAEIEEADATQIVPR